MGGSPHLLRAIELAAPHHTHPNPRVGAVIVAATGSVVGEGAHTGPGHPHAEVVALEAAGPGAVGGTIYVTLEPCTHHGLTPPCVDALIAAGIARVVVGAIDPDPRVSGTGVDTLRRAGVDVVTGMLEPEAVALDRAYFHQRRTGLPLVTLKLAMTLDGAVAARDGSSKWITSEAARADAHLLRAGADAVVVGAGTLRQDDPLLTARADRVTRQPRPVVVAGDRPLPAERRLWEREPIVIATSGIKPPSGELLLVEGGEGGLPDPSATARALADAGFYDILLEGGPGLAGSWWRSGVVDRGVLYLAGRVAGGSGLSPLGGDFATMAESREVTIGETRMVGPDLRIEFS